MTSTPRLGLAARFGTSLAISLLVTAGMAILAGPPEAPTVPTYTYSTTTR